MKVINLLKMTILSQSVNEGFGRVAIAGFLNQLDPTIEQLTDMKTAVSEAITNAVVHGYRDKTGNIYITVAIYENRTVRITIKDKGVGISNVKQAMEPMFTTDKAGERAGLGFAVMMAFADKVKVFSQVGKGTRVTIIKSFEEKETYEV